MFQIRGKDGMKMFQIRGKLGEKLVEISGKSAIWCGVTRLCGGA